MTEEKKRKPIWKTIIDVVVIAYVAICIIGFSSNLTSNNKLDKEIKRLEIQKLELEIKIKKRELIKMETDLIKQSWKEH